MVYHFYFESAERAYNLKLSDNPKRRVPVRILKANHDGGVELLQMKLNELKLVSYQNTRGDRRVYIESVCPNENRLDIYLTDKGNRVKYPKEDMFRFEKDGSSLEIYNRGSVEAESFFISFHYGEAIFGEVYVDCIPSDQIYDMVLDFGSEASQMLIIQNESSDRDESEIFNDSARHFYGINPDNIQEKTYDQQEDDDKLFRSIFFLPKQVNEVSTDEHAVVAKPGKDDPLLDFITKRDDMAKGQRLPNIKISYLSGETPDEIDPEKLHQAIVMRFIHEAVMEVKEKEKRKGNRGRCAIRMYILVPNVMGQVQLSRFIQAIRRHTDSAEFRSLLPESMQNVVFDISTYSESDASFISWLDGKAIEPGNYLIIDVGKGTTDFSIVKVEDGSSAVSVYRSGFVGAGNALTYAMFENYIISMSGSLEYKDIIQKVLTEAKDAYLYRLENILENYKRLEDPVISTNKNDLKIIKGMTTEKIIDLIKERGPIDDKREIIQSTIYQILEKIVVNVKETQFNKVILSGRAFKYKPFREAAINILEKFYHLEGRVIPMDDEELKRGCLRGPLLPLLINMQSDMIGIPIKVDVTRKEDEEEALKQRFKEIIDEIQESRDLMVRNKNKSWTDTVKDFCYDLVYTKIGSSLIQDDIGNRGIQIVNLGAKNDDIVKIMRGELETDRCDANTRFYVSDDQYVPENRMNFDRQSYKLFFDGTDFYARDERSSMKLKASEDALKKDMLYESLFPYPYRILPENYDIPDVDII